MPAFITVSATHSRVDQQHYGSANQCSKYMQLVNKNYNPFFIDLRVLNQFGTSQTHLENGRGR
jgi:hypothetical protein